jgi:guanylate kinase
MATMEEAIAQLTFEEVKDLEKRKDELKVVHQSYLAKHPELESMLGDFMSALLLAKPDNVLDFAKVHFKAEAKVEKRRPLVVCGPSGVGKGTLVGMLMKAYPDDFAFSVSSTTRPPREGEQDGIHYHFTDVEAFQTAIENGKFIEHAQVHDNLYGTSAESVETIARSGRVCVLDIDIQGAELVRASDLNPYFIFIDPPSMELLEQRLRERKTETEEKIQIRLENATKELEYGHVEGNFDANVINDSLEKVHSMFGSFGG